MKQNLGIIRAVDKLGRITLPAQYRQVLAINIDDPLAITMENDAIVMRKAVPTCIFCGADSHVTLFKERMVCADCLKELKKLP